MRSISIRKTFDMAFREKRAWVSLVAWIVPFTAYFALVPAAPAEASGEILRRLGWFAAATLSYGMLLGIGIALIAAHTPRNERGKPDERDRVIELRATSWAYGVMLTGMIVVGIVYPFEQSGWAITNAALFTIVAAEVVREIVTVIAYRRGA